MNQTLVLLAGLLTAGFSAAAQAPAAPVATPTQPSPDQPAQRRAQYLARELGLSADQQARLEPILRAQRQDLQALRTEVQTSGRRRSLGPDLKAAQARYTEQIRAVLTPEQFTKFQQLKEEQRDKLRERRAGSPGPGQ